MPCNRLTEADLKEIWASPVVVHTLIECFELLWSFLLGFLQPEDRREQQVSFR